MPEIVSQQSKWDFFFFTLNPQHVAIANEYKCAWHIWRFPFWVLIPALNLLFKEFYDLFSFSSSFAPFPCGVLQSSILGPVLFALYLLPLGTIIRKYGISFHFYADDSQIYLKPLKTNDSDCAQHLFDCLQNIKAWMALTFLNFSENIRLKIPSGGYQCPTRVGYMKTIITNLIVKNYHNLLMDQQILKSSFFQLEILVKVKPFLIFNHFERVVRAYAY